MPYSTPHALMERPPPPCRPLWSPQALPVSTYRDCHAGPLTICQGRQLMELGPPISTSEWLPGDLGVRHSGRAAKIRDPVYLRYIIDHRKNRANGGEIWGNGAGSVWVQHRVYHKDLCRVHPSTAVGWGRGYLGGALGAHPRAAKSKGKGKGRGGADRRGAWIPKGLGQGGRVCGTQAAGILLSLGLVRATPSPRSDLGAGRRQRQRGEHVVSTHRPLYYAMSHGRCIRTTHLPTLQ